MFFHADPTTDPFVLVLAMAHRKGMDLCVHCLVDSRDEAGTLDARAPPGAGISPMDAALIDTLLHQAQILPLYLREQFCDEQTAICRLRIVAKIAYLLLPAQITDHEDRYTLTLSDDGSLPHPWAVQTILDRHLRDLTQYLGEHDAGEWVDINALAGEVANVHDAA